MVGPENMVTKELVGLKLVIFPVSSSGTNLSKIISDARDKSQMQLF